MLNPRLPGKADLIWP